MTCDPAIVTSDHRAFRYAQVSGGQKLHIAEMFADGYVIDRAICGQRAHNGTWRMTINMPLAHACKKCVRLIRKIEN